MIHRLRTQVLAVTAALALFAGLGAAIHAQNDGPGRRGGFGHRGLARAGFPGLAQLDLTDAQRQQVRETVQRYRDQTQETGKKLRDAHDAQRAAVESMPINEGLIRSTTQTLANAQTDMALLRARIHNDVWSLLTPEQQEKAKELKAQRETRMKQRRQRGPRQQADLLHEKGALNETPPSDPDFASLLRRLDDVLAEAARLRAQVQEAMAPNDDRPFWPERRRERVPVPRDRRG